MRKLPVASIGLFALASISVLSACQTTTTASTTPAAASTAGDKQATGAIALKSGDAPALAGVWKGGYKLQNGWTGQTRMELTATGPETVEGSFEYRWAGGGYDRVPSSGTTGGRILPNGTLAFGSFILRLEDAGGKHTFRTDSRLANQPAKIDWSRSGIVLADRATLNASEPAPAPLAASTAVAPPGAEVSEGAAAFSGFWAGTWGGVLDGKLVVQTIDQGGKISGVYSWGDHPSGRFAAGSTPVTGQITGGVLTLARFGNGAVARFTMRGDGALDGTYNLNGNISRGIFTKS